jgi:hypothetical protein
LTLILIFVTLSEVKPRQAKSLSYMPNDSLEILWRGSDPAKFTALQAALRDEGIRFRELLAHDHAGGFLNSRPFYLESMPGFEIRVHSSDLLTAQGILATLESRVKDSESRDAFARESDDSFTLVPTSPFAWDEREATSEVWSGEDESQAEYIASALGENGIPCLIPDDPGHRLRLCVRPLDLLRAREIVREITGR